MKRQILIDFLRSKGYRREKDLGSLSALSRNPILIYTKPFSGTKFAFFTLSDVVKITTLGADIICARLDELSIQNNELFFKVKL